jgi:CheY-like chemotaxis protein
MILEKMLPTEQGPMMANGTILIVEDNSLQREGLALALRQRGFAVLPAADAQEAIELLERTNPDLVLLDMLIPNDEGDGWWFLKQRQQLPRLASIPVVITTAIAVASKEWAHSLGADGLIHKPIAIEPLVAAIERCLDQV